MKTTILAAAVLLCPFSIWAADDIKPFDAKPGLWETTSTTEMTGMPAMPAMPQIPEDQLSKMPPQQRAQIEAMIKSRMGAGGPRTNVSKSCLTKESLSKALGMGQTEANCTRKVVSSSASMQNIHVECAQGKMNMTGDLMVERVDAEHAKGTMVMKASGEMPMNMKMSFTTKWLSADCGDVKPIGDK